MNASLCGAELCGYGCELPRDHSGKHAAIVGSIVASPGWPMDPQEIRALILERDSLAAVSRTLREALEAARAAAADAVNEAVGCAGDDEPCAANEVCRIIDAALGSIRSVQTAKPPEDIADHRVALAEALAVSRTLREALEAVDEMCEDVFMGGDDVGAAMNDISRTVSAALGPRDGAEL